MMEFYEFVRVLCKFGRWGGRGEGWGGGRGRGFYERELDYGYGGDVSECYGRDEGE